jgi:hypothetical protein
MARIPIKLFPLRMKTPPQNAPLETRYHNFRLDFLRRAGRSFREKRIVAKPLQRPMASGTATGAAPLAEFEPLTGGCGGDAGGAAPGMRGGGNALPLLGAGCGETPPGG